MIITHLFCASEIYSEPWLSSRLFHSFPFIMCSALASQVLIWERLPVYDSRCKVSEKKRVSGISRKLFSAFNDI